MQVRTNADTPKDAKAARNFGAQGIGLTRTEHMFFEVDRIKAMREMILADTVKGRNMPLKIYCPCNAKILKVFLKLCKGLPVTIVY